jgi:hypothetical protein
MKIDERKVEMFLDNAVNFFAWNSGKNVPNVLDQMSGRIESLERSLAEASKSSDRLASSLNRITLAATVIGGLSLILAAYSLFIK